MMPGNGSIHHLRTTPTAKKARRKLACPFFKRRPSEHQQVSCWRSGFPDMSKLKFVFISSFASRLLILFRDHLVRVHMRPNTPCEWCWQDERTLEEMIQHVQSSPDCAAQLEPADKWVQDDVLNSMGCKPGEMFEGIRSQEEKWKILYQTLFPHDATVPSPCKSFGVSFHRLPI